nr:class IIb bacteriocin, lactobin A/cerein 7B family [uncultured Carboxylicivirga sp.]
MKKIEIQNLQLLTKEEQKDTNGGGPLAIAGLVFAAGGFVIATAYYTGYAIGYLTN